MKKYVYIYINKINGTTEKNRGIQEPEIWNRMER